MIRLDGFSNAGSVHEADHVLSGAVAIEVGQSLIVLESSVEIPGVGIVPEKVELGEEVNSIGVVLVGRFLEEFHALEQMSGKWGRRMFGLWRRRRRSAHS